MNLLELSACLTLDNFTQSDLSFFLEDLLLFHEDGTIIGRNSMTHKIWYQTDINQQDAQLPFVPLLWKSS